MLNMSRTSERRRRYHGRTNIHQFSPSRNGCGLHMKRLPAELIMKIMFHMDKATILDFGSTSKRIRYVWQLNMLAIFQGMKEAQFPSLVHIFGNPSRCSLIRAKA